MSNIIEVKGLNKKFDDTEVLKNINFHVQKSEVVAIIGPSGTGKSTLLRCLNFLTIPDEGIIKINGKEIKIGNETKKDIRDLRLNTAMVFQHYNLFRNMTAIQNVMEALITVKRFSKKEAEQKALKYIKKVGMEDRRDFYPSKLSGGQQQRVGIARALAMEPEVLLLDEPTSALDPELVGEVLKTIQDLAKEHSTMLLVTHEIKFALKVADRIIFMDDGSIAFSGSPEEMINSKNVRLKQFIGSF
ncbi:MAG: amino acid ABC transporter ATP-binding protein [Finegoldia magna]|nr:amino acid ABC transporter ATP-binding protein [Finegoldia magna]